jgi:CRP-like cAMP-binding protein
MKRESSTVSRRLIAALEKRSNPVSCEEGRTLFKQGEPARGLYILESGEAALMMESPSGRPVGGKARP